MCDVKVRVEQVRVSTNGKVSVLKKDFATESIELDQYNPAPHWRKMDGKDVRVRHVLLGEPAKVLMESRLIDKMPKSLLCGAFSGHSAAYLKKLVSDKAGNPRVLSAIDPGPKCMVYLVDIPLNPGSSEVSKHWLPKSYARRPGKADLAAQRDEAEAEAAQFESNAVPA